MIKFDEYIEEKREKDDDGMPSDDSLATKKSLVNFIASNLFRFANKPEGDTKGLMLLVAALGVLNTSDDANALNVARRLATAALMAKSK